MADLKRPKGDDYVPIFNALLMDVEALTGLDLALDARTIARRVNKEGLSFLTKTLPAYYKQILRCVEEGLFTPVVGFKRRRSGPLPLFLGGLVEGLFADDGSLREMRESSWLGYIGQICTVMYKCEFPYTPAQESQRLSKFLEVESELPETLGCLSHEAETVLLNAMELGTLVLRDFSVTELPKHGPGAVADGSKAEEKYDFCFSERIEEAFPYNEWFSTFINTMPDHSEGPPRVPDSEIPSGLLGVLYAESVSEDWETSCPQIPAARGIFVNKDSRGPRYISAEPKELMWLQQAIGRSVMRHLEHHPLTRGHVNFSDQTINGDLALSSSVSRRFATIDLEDASDRVSLALVRMLLPSNLVRLLEVSRSNSAVLPNGTCVDLKKFAPMGSACCFPIESLVFFLLSTACVMYVTGKDPMEAKDHVYVYGDDIIIDRKYADVLFRVFPELDLAVNLGKSYVKGPFRESCGVDAIDGIDVTPVKLRRPAPKSKADVSTLISWAETSNLMFYAGFWRTADYLVRQLESFCPVPYVPFQSGLFGKTGYYNALSVRGRRLKWDKHLHRLKVKARVLVSSSRDWGFDPAPFGATLHTLAKKADGHSLSYEWQVKGRVDASTMISDTAEDKSFLRLHHKFVLI